MSHGLTLSFKAGADIGEYNVVKFDSNGNVVPATSASDQAAGVAQYEAKSGRGVAVTVIGYTKVVASGAIAAGARLKAASNGQVAAVGGEAAGSTVNVIGYAISKADAAGDIIEAVLVPSSYTVPSDSSGA